MTFIDKPKYRCDGCGDEWGSETFDQMPIIAVFDVRALDDAVLAAPASCELPFQRAIAHLCAKCLRDVGLGGIVDRVNAFRTGSSKDTASNGLIRPSPRAVTLAPGHEPKAGATLVDVDSGEVVGTLAADLADAPVVVERS